VANKLNISSKSCAGAYRYGFEGQELDRETGFYSYKYRMHDPRLGRFLSVDPLAPEYPHNSPYAFCENRMIDGVELEGLERQSYMKEDGNYVEAIDRYTEPAWKYDIPKNDPVKEVQTTIGPQTKTQAAAGKKVFDKKMVKMKYDLGLSPDASTSQTVKSKTKSDAFAKTYQEAEYYTFKGGMIALDIGLTIYSLGGSSLVTGSLGFVESRVGMTAFRYMTQAELQAIRTTNLLRGGRAGETFFTKDLFSSSLKAQSRLALPSAPTLRVEFEILHDLNYLRNGTKVKKAYGMSGGGAEFLTEDIVKVRLINWQPLH
jgi:RHS repeat-associated protein